MAKTVGDLLIKLGVDGIEGVAALKGSLRTLGNVSTASDKQLERLRKEIVQVAKASNVSQQSIRGQIDAFKGLKQQATIGSSVYKRLGKDIDAITQSLDRLNRKEEETKKQRTAKQIFGTESVAVVPEKFNRQIAAGNELLQKLGVTSTQYATQLAAVTARTQEFSRAQQRQQVVAQNLVATNRAQATGFLQSSKVNIENTHTTAALKQKIAELTQDLDNIDVGSKEYITTSNRLKDAQEELNVVLGISSKAFDELARAQERAERRAKKLADIQQYYGTSRTGEGQAAQRAGGFRDPVTGAMIARGTRAGRASLVQQPMREISSLYSSIGDIGMSQISADIDRMGKSYEKVAQDIREATLASNGSVNSLQAQRASWAQLRAGLDPTSKAYQNVGREIEKVDRQLEKLNKRRRRPTIGGAASALGGIAAGGVFGGPEGAIGGAIGGVFGGVAGVAAGAAIGAQVKMLREALGATSEYAAELQKLEIALEGVAGARYTDALEVAADVTRDFNVPLAVSTKGITRLSAAIIGAGGDIDDAEVVFRNITSAIKATGGGAQDVESAITAMVQTFSKGKVSAEELSGQLGERLPGAVTKFAEANNMTLPELQKAFKAGTVGLDQLMKFIISLGPEYEKTARRIADSSADAGARATVAFEQVRREIGEALQPIGAELQEAFAEFALEVLPAVKAAAVAAAAGMKALMDATATLVANFKEILIVAGTAGVALVFTNLSAIMLGLAAALGKATVAMKGFTAASLLNPWVALATGIAAATVAIVKHTRRHKEFNKAVLEGQVTNEEANDKLRKLNTEIKELEALKEKTGNNQMLIALTSQIETTKKAAEELKLAMKLATPYTVSGITYDPATGAAINAPMSYTPTDFDDPILEDDGDKGKAPMSEIELALRRQLREALAAENEILASNLQLGLDSLQAYEETEDLLARTNMLEEANFQHRQRIKDINEEDAANQQKKLDLQKNASRVLQDAQFAAEGRTAKELESVEIQRQLSDFAEKFKEAYTAPELQDALNKLEENLRKALDPMTKMRKGLREIFEEAMNVKDALANKAVEAVNTLGDTFADFVATGKADFKEFTVSLLQDLSRIFAKMALFQGLSLIPGVGSFLGLTASKGAVVKGMTSPTTLSGKNGIMPFARGGIVTKPTLFKYADGGSGRFGLMGEAGSEAIMPLRRGRNGKLGVESSGGVGNVVVNVDASGSSVEGNQPNAKLLGAVIGAAVQSELIKQKRPGGLLS